MADTVSNNKNDSEYNEIIDSQSVRDAKIDRLAKMIRKHKGKITFYTGAGISTGAGIPDFRSGIGSVTGMPAGKWCHDATKKDWNKAEKNEDAARRAKTISTLQAIPTKSHMALVAMAKAGMLKGLISQNCDGLHRRSGFPPELLAELHGNTNLEYCGWCGKEYMRDFRASSGRHVAGRKLLKEVWPEHKKNKKLINPRRGRHYTGRRCMVVGCEGYLFDSVIDFGDNLPEKHINRGYEMAENCELCIVLGSRCSVSPACEMPIGVGETVGKKLVVVNLQRTAADDVADLRIGAKIDDVMVPVMKKLGIQIPEFALSRCVRVKNSGKKVSVGGFDPDGTPNDLIWNVQARMLVKPNSESATTADTGKTVNKSLHPIMLKVNKECANKRRNAPKPGDSAVISVWPWLNRRNPGLARANFVTGAGKGHSYGIPPTLLSVQDTKFIAQESLDGESISFAPLPSSGERIERLWTDRRWYPAVVGPRMGDTTLRLLYPASNEAEDVNAETFAYGVEWRYPAGTSPARARAAHTRTRTVLVANAGQCRGPRLMHDVDIPQPDASGKVRCSGTTMSVGKHESVKIDTLRLMFRAHYREPPLTLPTPSAGKEQCYRTHYSPSTGMWKVEELDCPDISAVAATAPAISSK